MSNDADHKTDKASLSLKETPPTPPAKAEPRYATPEMLEKALKKVMAVHGEAFRKLAE